jgi:aryl-alcohol dehydrogenase-like predicted oxidoreductase
MWGMGAWSGSEDNESLASLQRAIDFRCNFCDTARVYGDGRSEKAPWPDCPGKLQQETLPRH